MADHRYAATLWASTENAVRKAASATLQYVLKTLKIGPATDTEPAGNFGGIWYKAVTSSVASQEFSVFHQQNQVPTLVLQGLPLNVVGAQIVPLEVSQAADANRIYLKSTSTGATCYLYCEFGGL